MKKLKNSAKKAVVGGAGGLTGALFSGMASLVNSFGNLFATIVGTIVNAVHSFTDNHVKADYKYGSSSVTYDDGKQVDADVKKEENAQKHEEQVQKNESQSITAKINPTIEHSENEQTSTHDKTVANHSLDLNNSIDEHNLSLNDANHEHLIEHTDYLNSDLSSLDTLEYSNLVHEFF